jgi:hypothetical protein
MKKIWIVLGIFAVLVLSVSQIFIWKDQQQMWQIMNTQIQMLQRIIDRNSDAPFIYEDEMPENVPNKQSQDI